MVCSVPSRNVAALLLMLTWCETTVSLGGEADDGNAWKAPLLPKVELPQQGDPYSEQGKRLGLEGRVLIAFDITPAGSTENLSIIWAEDPTLAAKTMRLLTGARFKVPADWGTSGAWRRWRAGFVYCLPPSGQSDDFAIPTEKIYIM